MAQIPDELARVAVSAMEAGADEIIRLRRDLAQVRNELVLALPTEDERQVLRWIREIIHNAGNEVHHDIRYPAALELLQRLLTMKVNHNG